jgi:hypothetical protein
MPSPHRPSPPNIEELLLIASSSAVATIRQWMADCTTLQGDPFSFTDAGKTYHWWALQQQADGSITGRVQADGSKAKSWKVRPDGVIANGTAWMRRHRARLEELPAAPSGWPISTRVAVVVLDPIPLSELEPLTTRVQQFFGAGVEVIVDAALSQRLDVPMALLVRSTVAA